MAIQTLSDGAVRRIVFARPEKKNAFTNEMYEGLIAALREADTDSEVRVILLSGAGGSFTAGNDLGDFLNNPPRDVDAAVLRLLLLLVDLQTPLVCAVDGAAVGIGTTLLLHADYVVASSRARFATPFVNLGLTPEGGSTVLLRQLVGTAKATEWLLFGEPFDAAAALQAGLINAVVPAEELEAFALQRAHVLASKPPQALLATRRVLREPMRARAREAIRAEGAVFLERLQSAEAKAAFTAFLGKKK